MNIYLAREKTLECVSCVGLRWRTGPTSSSGVPPSHICIRKLHLEQLLLALTGSPAYTHIPDLNMFQLVLDCTHPSCTLAAGVTGDQLSLAENVTRNMIYMMYKMRLKLLNALRPPTIPGTVPRRGVKSSPPALQYSRLRLPDPQHLGGRDSTNSGGQQAIRGSASSSGGYSGR